MFDGLSLQSVIRCLRNISIMYTYRIFENANSNCIRFHIVNAVYNWIEKISYVFKERPFKNTIHNSPLFFISKLPRYPLIERKTCRKLHINCSFTKKKIRKLTKLTGLDIKKIRCHSFSPSSRTFRRIPFWPREFSVYATTTPINYAAYLQTRPGGNCNAEEILGVDHQRDNIVIRTKRRFD